MEIIKRKICIEDFVNRYNGLDSEGKNTWGKILNDVIIDGDLLDIGLYYDEYIPHEDENMNSITEWNQDLLLLMNINEVFEEIKDGGVKRYVQVKYNNVLPLSEYEKKLIIRNKSLMKLNKFLIDFEYSLTYYIKCDNKWVEIDEKYLQENNIVINGFFEEASKEKADGIYSITKDTPIVYDIREIGEDNEHKLACQTPLANKFNEVFRQNNKFRYEVLLKNKIDDFLEGKTNNNETTKPYVDILLSLQQSINSLGLYENSIRQIDNDKYYVDDNVYDFDENKKVNTIYKLSKGNNIEYSLINENILDTIKQYSIVVEDYGGSYGGSYDEGYGGSYESY